MLDRIAFDRLTEDQVVALIVASSARGEGGWVLTPNVDIMRALRTDPALRSLVANATLVVPDGMPLIWAARLRGQPLPARVAGSALIWSLSGAAAAYARSVYLLGGEPGVPERAAERLVGRFRGLRVVGADAPPVGFDETPAGIDRVRRAIVAATPDIAFVGMGFPKQERLIVALRGDLPRTWFVGCGAAITFAAGLQPRAPAWMQAVGLEWLHRLAREPRRLVRRYLVDDLPYAARLLGGAALARAGRASGRPR